MTKVEVTAENRPACDSSQYVCIHATCKTDEYQCRVQILVISLVKFLVMLLGQLVVIFIELRANLLRSRAHFLSLTVGEVLVVFRGDMEWNLPIFRFLIFHHNFLLLRLSSKVLAAVGRQPKGMSLMKYRVILQYAALQVVRTGRTPTPLGSEVQPISRPIGG